MTDPTKALADAARVVQVYVRQCVGHGQSCDDHWLSQVLGNALAAYDAAQATEQAPPTDEEIEAAIDAFGQAVFEAGKATGKPQWVTDMMTRSDVVAASHKALLAFMRRARPNRQALTDAEVEGCTVTELREALFSRNNDVERIAKQRDALLQAAKAVVDGYDACDGYVYKARINTLRAEVERASKGGAA